MFRNLIYVKFILIIFMIALISVLFIQEVYSYSKEVSLLEENDKIEKNNKYDDSRHRYLTIVLAQVGSNINDSKKPVEVVFKNNFEKFEEQVKFAKTSFNPDLIVFPETFLYFSIEDHSIFNKEIPNDITDKICKIAKDNDIWIIPGTFFEKYKGLVYNTAIVVNNKGKIVRKYSKIFPAIPMESLALGKKKFNDDYIDETGYGIFEIPGKGKIGVIICYDYMYPEIMRTLSWMGAELIIQPANHMDLHGIPSVSKSISLTRAVENQCFFARVNSPEPFGNGHSFFIDPEGATLIESGEGESLIAKTIDLSESYRVRKYGSFSGGYCFMKHLAVNGPINYPLYKKGIKNGDLYKQIGLDFPGYKQIILKP